MLSKKKKIGLIGLMIIWITISIIILLINTIVEFVWFHATIITIIVLLKIHITTNGRA